MSTATVIDNLPAVQTLGLIHAARKAGISTLLQLRGLLLLGNGTRTISEIAQALRITVAGASGIADVLERAELISRHRQLFNRRHVYLELTQTGRDLLTARISHEEAL